MPRPLTAGARSRAVALLWHLRTSERLALCALAAWSVALATVGWRTWGNLAEDTGYDLLAAANVASGQMPYADFSYFYGPLGVFLLGGVYWLAGVSVDAAIAVGLVMAAAIVVLSYRLGRTIAGPPAGFLVAALAATAAFSTGNMSAVLPYTMTAPLAIICSLSALLWLVRGRCVLAGVAAGLVALTRPEFVAALGVAIGAWLLLRATQPEIGLRGALREAAQIAAPALAIPVLVYGAFMTQVSPGALLSENLFPLHQLRAGGDEVVRSAIPLTTSSFLELGGRLVLYAAGAGAVLALAMAMKRGGHAKRGAIMVVAVASCCALIVLVVNPEAVRTQLQQAWGWIPAAAVITAVALLWHGLRARAAATPGLPLALALSAFVAVLAATTYDQFFPYSTFFFSNKAAYAMPFAAAFLAWLHLRVLPRWGGAPARAIGIAWLALLALVGGVLVARDAGRESLLVRGPGGALADGPGSGAAHQRAVDWMVRSTSPGEPVLVAPQLTWLHIVADRPSPLTQPTALPGALTPEAEAESIRRMASVNLAVIDTHRFTQFGHGAFGETFDRGLAARLRRDFRRVATLRDVDDVSRTLEIWRRTKAAM